MDSIFQGQHVHSGIDQPKINYKDIVDTPTIPTAYTPQASGVYVRTLNGSGVTHTTTDLAFTPRKMTAHGWIRNTGAGKYGVVNGTAERDISPSGFMTVVFTDGSLYSIGNSLSADSASFNVRAQVTAWTANGFTVTFTCGTGWEMALWWLVEN
jgi:hypothetical protein